MILTKRNITGVRYVNVFNMDAGWKQEVEITQGEYENLDNPTIEAWTWSDSFEWNKYDTVSWALANDEYADWDLMQYIKIDWIETTVPSWTIVNDVISDAFYINPPKMHNGEKLNVFYATQVATRPPTFVMFVNDTDIMHFSYERYLKNRLRESFDFEGTTIKLLLRKRD